MPGQNDKAAMVMQQFRDGQLRDETGRLVTDPQRAMEMAFRAARQLGGAGVVSDADRARAGF